MSLPIENAYKLLREHVLVKSGIKVISPGDCKEIAGRIEKLSGKVISETTLKRFFGFASQKYSFSKYSLNALCEYAGYEGWDHFYQAVSTNGNGEKLVLHTLWKEFREKAMQTTLITHKILKNLSGIPFPHTISRLPLEADFKSFMESDFQFFCLTGAPDIGKTLQVTHLVEKFFLTKNAPYQSSIIWFLRRESQKDLLSHDIDLDKLMDDQFNMHNGFNFLEYFRRRPDQVEGKLVLVMDGLDDYFYERAQLDDAFEKVIHLLGYVNKEKWLKIVLSLRTSTWHILQQKFEQTEQLKRSWFPGISYQENLKSNMPVLNKREIMTILHSFHKETGTMLYPCQALFSLFTNPYYLSLYYHILKTDINNKNFGDALFCVLINSFIEHKLHSARDYVEKDHLLRKLVNVSGYGESSVAVEKNKLLQGNEGYIEAYYNLINEGILVETYDRRNFDHHIYVRFLHEPLYTYFLSREWIERHAQDNHTISLEEWIKQYPPGEKREMLVKWLIWHNRSRNPGTFINMTFYDGLLADETWNLINFTCDILANVPVTLTAAQKETLVDKSVSFIAHHFMEFSCLNKKHEKTIQLLINYAQSEGAKAHLLIVQSILAMMRMDKTALWKAMRDLRKIGQETFIEYFPIHPVKALEFLLHFYSLDSMSTEPLETIEAFIQKPPYTYAGDWPQTNEVLTYQFTIFILSLCRRRYDIIAFVDTVQYLHPGLFEDQQCSGVTMHLLLRKAFAFLRTNRDLEAIQIKNKVEECLADKKTDISHSALLLELLKGEIALRKGDHRKAIDHFLYAYKQSKQNEFAMFQVYASLSLLKVYKMNNDFTELISSLNDVQKSLQDIDFPVKELLLRGLMESA